MKEKQDSAEKNHPDEEEKSDVAGENSQGSYISIFLKESKQHFMAMIIFCFVLFFLVFFP